jgi:hypothetical protein
VFGWKKVTSQAAFPARYNHQGVVFKNKMYLIGGYKIKNFGILADIWSSTDGKDWKKVRQESGPKLPACHQHQVVVFENKMYLFGGYGDGGDGSGGARYVEKIWSSSDGAFWSEKSSTLIFKNHQVVVFNNKLFWIAGQSKNNGEENSVYSSTDGATFKVVIEKAGFTARTAHQVVVFKDKLYLIGGSTTFGSDFKKLNDVWSSTDGKNWTQETDQAPFPARWSHQVVVFKNKIYLIGGYDGTKALNDVWSYGALDEK